MLMKNDGACELVGIEIVQIEIHNRVARMLIDIRHVPKQRKNLI